MVTDHRSGHFTHGFTFERLPEGTRISQEVTFQPRGVAKLMAPMMMPMLRRMVRNLDRQIESTVGGLVGSGSRV